MELGACSLQIGGILKFVALPVPGIIGGTKKIWAVPGYSHTPFSPKFWWAFVRMDL